MNEKFEAANKNFLELEKFYKAFAKYVRTLNLNQQTCYELKFEFMIEDQYVIRFRDACVTESNFEE